MKSTDKRVQSGDKKQLQSLPAECERLFPSNRAATGGSRLIRKSNTGGAGLLEYAKSEFLPNLKPCCLRGIWIVHIQTNRDPPVFNCAGQFCIVKVGNGFWRLFIG